jgi:hypothetical protein
MARFYVAAGGRTPYSVSGMPPTEPIAIQLALAEAHAVAEQLLADEGEMPLFVVFHRGQREPPLVAVLRRPTNDEDVAVASLREDAPAIARGHGAAAVTLGGAGVMARGADGDEASAVWQGLRAGTLASLREVPGSRGRCWCSNTTRPGA